MRCDDDSLLSIVRGPLTVYVDENAGHSSNVV